jgi:hypothetical protein
MSTTQKPRPPHHPRPRTAPAPHPEPPATSPAPSAAPCSNATACAARRAPRWVSAARAVAGWSTITWCLAVWRLAAEQVCGQPFIARVITGQRIKREPPQTPIRARPGGHEHHAEAAAPHQPRLGTPLPPHLEPLATSRAPSAAPCSNAMACAARGAAPIGVRCESRAWLEYHHVVPRGLGARRRAGLRPALHRPCHHPSAREAPSRRRRRSAPGRAGMSTTLKPRPPHHPPLRPVCVPPCPYPEPLVTSRARSAARCANATACAARRAARWVSAARAVPGWSTTTRWLAVWGLAAEQVCGQPFIARVITGQRIKREPPQTPIRARAGGHEHHAEAAAPHHPRLRPVRAPRLPRIPSLSPPPERRPPRRARTRRPALHVVRPDGRPLRKRPGWSTIMSCLVIWGARRRAGLRASLHCSGHHPSARRADEPPRRTIRARMGAPMSAGQKPQPAHHPLRRNLPSDARRCTWCAPDGCPLRKPRLAGARSSLRHHP